MKGVREGVFVDTGAWIALAVREDPYHERAVAAWRQLLTDNVRLVTSVPVVIETFTFLDRNGDRTLACRWRDEATASRRVQIVECALSDLTKAWAWIERREMLRLSVVDATSFVLMRRLRLGAAFAFDQHFAQAGFRVVG